MALGVLLGATHAPALAQPSPTDGFPLRPDDRQLLCSPRVATDDPDASVRLIGSEEGPQRRLYVPDLPLVVSGGAADGLEGGQLWVVRRVGPERLQPRGTRNRWIGIRTLGVVRILEANDGLSTAEVVEMCEAFAEGDFLEPYVPTAAPPAVLSDDPPDFAQAGSVLFGALNRPIAGAGEYVVVDMTLAPGALSGQTVSFFRPALADGGPVRVIGRGIVAEVTGVTATVRIEEARDAVSTGDGAALHPVR